MKQLLSSAVIAAIVSFLVYWGLGGLGRDSAVPSAEMDPPQVPAVESGVPVFSVTDALVEDTWVNAARTAGSDLRTLTDASNSVCYLTKIEISGVQGPDDKNSCAVEIDDFTGFWQLIATVDEGGRSEVRCNARCLTWEPSGEE
jgi:hypothetical protein